MKDTCKAWKLESCPVNGNLTEEDRIQCDECNYSSCSETSHYVCSNCPIRGECFVVDTRKQLT